MELFKKKSTNPQAAIYRRQKQMQRTGGFLVGLYRYILLISMSYVILYPLVFMISTSLKSRAAFLDPSIIWIPRSVTKWNYEMAIKALDLPSSALLTLKYEIVSAGIEIISCSIAAYGLARFDFKLKKILNVFLILLIFIPPQMIIIPMMMNFADLDLFGIFGAIVGLFGGDLRINTLNTVLPFYLPSILGVGLRSGIMIFMYMQFFKGLPRELEEAAWIDGAGPIRTYLKIALPSSGVIILTVSVFSIIWHWNDYYLAVMYTQGEFTLSVMLNVIKQTVSTMSVWNTTQRTAISMAACLLFIAPVLVMYMFLQRKFIKSIDRVGITG